MSRIKTGRPDPTEYAEFHAGYVNLVPEGDILEILDAQLRNTTALLSNLSEAQALFRYEPGKWTVKEVVGHMADTERVFGYRALRFARNDRTPIPGFEQNDYVENAAFNQQSLGDLLAEFEHLRRGIILMLRGLTPEAWLRRGIANDREISVRGMAHIIAGHELHHINVLRTKYL